MGQETIIKKMHIALLFILILTVNLIIVSRCCGGITKEEQKEIAMEQQDETTGLVVHISFTKDMSGKILSTQDSPVYKSGQTVYINATIENKSNKVWSFDVRQIRSPRTFPVTNPEGNQLPESAWIDYAIFPAVEEKINAKGKYSFILDINEFYPVKMSPVPGFPTIAEPGQYYIQMILRSPVQEYKISGDKKWPDDLWPKTIKSNILNFIIKGISEEEIKSYLSQLQSLPEKECIEIIKLLSANRVKAALPEILSILTNKDSSEKVKAEAMRILYRIGIKSIAPTMEKIMLEDKSRQIKSYAAGLLEQFGSKSCVPSLVKVLQDRYPLNYEENAANVWYAPVITALGKFGDKDVLPILDEVAQKDPTTWIRNLAAKNAKKIREKDVTNESEK